jgi:acylphosphatase
MLEPKRYQIRFLGKVQGVGFRATLQHLAVPLSVTGWVRNEADGSVLAEVQGTPGDLHSLLSAMLASRAGQGVREDVRLSVDPQRGESEFRIT